MIKNNVFRSDNSFFTEGLNSEYIHEVITHEVAYHGTS